MFGVLDLETPNGGSSVFDRFKELSRQIAAPRLTVGLRVMVCLNMVFSGDFTPVLAKHSKSFSLIDCISVGVDRMQRNFEPMRSKWRRGNKVNSPMSLRKWSSTKRSSRKSKCFI